MRPFFVTLVFLLFVTVGSFYTIDTFLKPLNKHTDVIVVIQHNTSSYGISKKLKEAGLIINPWILILCKYLCLPNSPLKAGEYFIPKGSSVIDIISKFRKGDFLVRKLCIPEGKSVHEVVEELNQNSSLSGEILKIPKEGYVLPETYHHHYGEKRATILDKMEKNLQQHLNDLWEQRSCDETVIKTPHDAVIFASIVEKEVRFFSEIPNIVSVYVNRLKLNMRLQADPTVIYALTLGERKLERFLTRKDLSISSPYNTYRVFGLPPTPICCPGLYTLKSVICPKLHDPKILYFVANGKGGHFFSNTLKEHNHYVGLLRDGMKNIKQES
ncbi:MAG: endolytic transglycosylase MltG [Alphaproteobacteria bacterium]